MKYETYFENRLAPFEEVTYYQFSQKARSLGYVPYDKEVKTNRYFIKIKNPNLKCIIRLLYDNHRQTFVFGNGSATQALRHIYNMFLSNGISFVNPLALESEIAHPNELMGRFSIQGTNLDDYFDFAKAIEGLKLPGDYNSMSDHRANTVMPVSKEEKIRMLIAGIKSKYK